MPPQPPNDYFVRNFFAIWVPSNSFRFPNYATPTYTHTHTNAVAPKLCCLTPIGATPHFKKNLNNWCWHLRQSPIARGANTSMCWQHLCDMIGLGFVVAKRNYWVFVWETRLVSSNTDVQLLLSVSCLPGDTKDDVRGDTIPSVQHRCVAIAPNGGCWSRVVSPPAPSIRKRDHAENLGQRE
jgi:hypothetical protein